MTFTKCIAWKWCTFDKYVIFQTKIVFIKGLLFNELNAAKAISEQGNIFIK